MSHTYRLDHPHSGSLADATGLVGGKAANLGVMARELGLPVPPGFVVTTSACRTFLVDGWPSGLADELHERMRELEEAVGRRFGDPSDPLLVSVRSGAPVSMPGMMDTILDLGLNAETCVGLARASGDDEFAIRCRERFEGMFRSIVGVHDVPADPWQQLRLAVEAVFGSWNSPRARAYRAKEGIADDLGTAVTVQAMVFGNRGPTSGTGVVFTRNPATGENVLFGDVLFEAQGEDVVAGTHATEPIAALDERLPAVASELREHAAALERWYRDLCDIEFTIEAGRLWMLQVRVGKRSPQAALRIAREMAEDPDFPLTREEAVRRVLPILADPPRVVTLARDGRAPLVVGLAASPGVASGPIATSAAGAIASTEAGRPPILVRAETSPEDVPGMARAAGVLTARGGLASHAAVVARGWGIPAVVGASGLEVRDGSVSLGGRTFRAGDVLTIDGATGEVFEGEVAGSSEIAPEAATLLEWARELRIEVSEPAQGSAPSPAAVATGAAAVSPDACLVGIAIKGFATPSSLADSVLSTPDAVESVVAGLVADSLVASSAGAYRTSEAGGARAAELIAADRTAWGEANASAALDAFLALDARMKELVTAWQLRDPAAQVLNDHSDGAYDASVLDRLAALHEDVVAWLASTSGGPSRLAAYGSRLGRALEAARAGDARYVASPRVDSYHGVWFELHEDLIRLAGRTREAESEAGRA
ncbi:MAG TPA: pyruvate, phosphate dikinase [Candidatus Limnocylindrales bacterium]|nr:pyruvate, phosphate dikinase [Candidatus Limnocylindrales bacterium]